MRKEFEMTEAQQKELLSYINPCEILKKGKSINWLDLKEEANKAWARLGDEMGFKYPTVQSVPGKPNNFFTAETK